MSERIAGSSAPALSYYASLAPAAGFQGRCAMSIPCDIEGKRVLDVCCRKGKGAFALADAAGRSGFVVGVDPDADNVTAACAAAPKNHWAGSSWEHYLRFSQALPENLSGAGIDDAVFELVYINSVLNLAWSMSAALAEFARVLAPGGRLWVAQGVFVEDGSDAQGERTAIEGGADGSCKGAAFGNDAAAPRSGAVLSAPHGVASVLGRCLPAAGGTDQIDVFSQARSLAAFERMCLEAGFSSVSFSSISPVSREDLHGREPRRGARFCLADACATI